MTRSVVAGTFNALHAGHEALIRRAFEEGDEVLVGITSDAAAARAGRPSVPLYLRRRELERLLSGMGKPWSVAVIDDMFGPRPLMDPAEVLVVSSETAANAALVNGERAGRGVPPMRVVEVPMAVSSDGSRISSTGVLSGRYSRDGRADAPDVSVGSLNPVKVEAVRAVMERALGGARVTPEDVSSGVPEQPFGDETREGAVNRAERALKGHSMSVGIEAGAFETRDGLYDVQYCAILDDRGRLTIGTGMGFRYPDAVAELVRGGETVGSAMRLAYGGSVSGRGQGAIGFLSDGLIDRKELTEAAVKAAMVPRMRDG
ncbi:MAG: inosine/xanthosine triphosphatase [Candidatus Methanoplasma sp.]|jgi:inosine/xanthosine triphosphatase|nr:inosine/xanthosine triphosphatase [Candidatus Methanoplasma sp.]